MAARRRSRLHRFYLIRPRANSNVEELAERLVELKHVEEVYVTDGDYGYLVKTRFDGEKDPDDAASYIRKNIGKRFGSVTSYFNYRKGAPVG